QCQTGAARELREGLEGAALMRATMSLDEFAALVDTPNDELRALTEAGLLDPDRRGHFAEHDPLRLMTVRHYAALGCTPEALAEALASGEVEPFLGEYIYPRGPQLSVEEAAGRLGIEPETLARLRTALGFTRETLLEDDLKLFEGLNVMAAAGMPFEAVLEGARAFGDTLRRLAEAEIETMGRVDAGVRGLALQHGGKVVKQIGDALMLAFRDSGDAVRFAAELEESVRRDASMPPLRVGMHCGPAIYRGGDYLGT